MPQPRDAGQRDKSTLKTVAKSQLFVCEFCKKSYVKAAALQKHLTPCHEKHVLRTRMLRRAYPLYERWFKAAKRATPTFDTFSDSRFGTHFIAFVDWCDMMNVVSTTTYVKVMLKEKLHPSIWSTPSSYKLYTEQFAETISVDEWLVATAGTIERICAAKNIPHSMFYAYTTPNELIHLLRTRALYPRYLVCDPLFDSYLRSLPVVIAKMLGDAIDDEYTSASMPCDPTIMSVIAHINA